MFYYIILHSSFDLAFHPFAKLKGFFLLAGQLSQLFDFIGTLSGLWQDPLMLFPGAMRLTRRTDTLE